MNKPQICLSLTGTTIAQNLSIIEKYRSKIDLVELRADYLLPEELFYIRTFPKKAGLPCILTVRRRCDGGMFDLGEGVRLVIFARGLAFADSNPEKNFAYIEVEHDFDISSIQEAARIFGTKLIRSRHYTKGFPQEIDRAWNDLASRPYEIPKLSVHTAGLEDVSTLFRLFSECRYEHIVMAVGDYSFCAGPLASRLGSMLVYASPDASSDGLPNIDTLHNVYHIRDTDASWNIYGLVGSASVVHSLSPVIHNAGFTAMGAKSIYVPFPANTMEAFIDLQKRLDIKGFSVTAPYKEKILSYIAESSTEVQSIKACNTVICSSSGWKAYNSDAWGFAADLKRFIGAKKLDGMRATIIGSGGAAKAIAFALKGLGIKACVINRSMFKAKLLAETYGFEWSGMTERAVSLISKYNDIIIQTTSVGSSGGQQGDPLEWYQFSGNEIVYETIYAPRETVFLKRAQKAGCKTCNGLGMLQAQALAQFKLFTNSEYPEGLLPSQTIINSTDIKTYRSLLLGFNY